MTFLLIVPAANALLDHASVQVSRWLLFGLVRRRSAPHQIFLVVLHVLIDVAFALLCLGLLAILLPAALQAANFAFDRAGWPAFAWGPYLDAARNDPLGKGWLVTGMLGTTLIPTILHLLAAGGALLVPWTGGEWVRSLAGKPDTDIVDRLGLATLVFAAIFFSWTALVLIAVILYQSIAVVLPLASDLADLAEFIGRTIGGPGAPE